MTENGEKPEKNNRVSIPELVKAFLPAIGVFTALIYLLGRNFVEEYYYNLGITRNVLVFTTEDYMFFSFNMVVMCLVFAVLFYLYWELFLWEEKAESTPCLFKISDFKAIIPISLVVWVATVIYCVFFSMAHMGYIPGFSGFCLGLALGLTLLLPAYLLRKFRPSRIHLSRKEISDRWKNYLKEIREPIGAQERTPFICLLVAGLVLVLSFTPVLTRGLAAAEADGDLTNFPNVRVIATANFSDEVRSALSGKRDCLDGQLVLINNGMVYVRKWFGAPKDQYLDEMAEKSLNLGPDVPMQTLTTEEMGEITVYRQIYAIPVACVKEIVYYSKGW